MKTTQRKALKRALLVIITIMVLATLVAPVAADGGPGSSQLVVAVNPSAPLPNQRIDVSGSLVGVTAAGTNTPLVGQTVSLRYTSNGGLTWSTKTTTTITAGAYAFINALPNEPASYDVQVSFAGNAQYSAVTSETAFVIPMRAAQLTVAQNPTNPLPNQRIDLYGYLSTAGAGSVRLSNQQIFLERSYDGGVNYKLVSDIPAITTGGVYSFYGVVPNVPSAYSFRVYFAGTAQYYSTYRDLTINRAPAIGTLTVSPTIAAVTKPVTATATFTDPDVNDAHTATFNWGDGTSTPVTAAPGVMSVSSTHAYTTPNTYAVMCRMKDATDTSPAKTATVRVISQRSVADEVQAFSAGLTSGDFKTTQNYKAYTNKLSALANTIEAGNYADAQAKIANDLTKRNTQWGINPAALDAQLANIANDLGALQAGQGL